MTLSLARFCAPHLLHERCLQGRTQTSFQVALQVALECMKRKMYHNNKDEFAVVLYNTVCAFVPQQLGRVCNRHAQHSVCLCSSKRPGHELTGQKYIAQFF